MEIVDHLHRARLVFHHVEHFASHGLNYDADLFTVRTPQPDTARGLLGMRQFVFRELCPRYRTQRSGDFRCRPDTRPGERHGFESAVLPRLELRLEQVQGAGERQQNDERNAPQARVEVPTPEGAVERHPLQPPTSFLRLGRCRIRRHFSPPVQRSSANTVRPCMGCAW